jgi:dephospho-CoA kinase
MKYLITGVAGTGKSSVAKALQAMGYAAYDADAGFSYYANKNSGEKVVRPANPSLDWYDKHERVFDENVLNNLFKKHSSELLFICSITANQSKFYPVFNKIFLLKAPDETIIKRLETRTNNHFGKHPLELQRVITRHEEFDEELLRAGAIAIDSTQPIEDVVEQILEQTK